MKTKNQALKELVEAAQTLLEEASERNEVSDPDTGEVSKDWAALIAALDQAKKLIVPLSDDEEEKRGILIGNMLGLRQKRGSTYTGYRYFTTWGSKTALGLYRTLDRLFEHTLDETCQQKIAGLDKKRD